MEGSLVVVDSSAAASLRATAAAAGRRRAAGRRSGSGILSCACSSRGTPACVPLDTCRCTYSDHEPATRATRAPFSSFGRMPRAANSVVARVNGWDGGNNGSHGGWTTAAALEEDSSSVLEAREDEYGGMVVDADRLPSDAAAFARSLPVSLSYWKSLGKKGVWLKLPLDRSEYIPLAVKEGFRYHHAEESYLMLTYWIPDDEPCLLPANASHQVGVGGFVINDKMEVLVVQEKYAASSLVGAWKLPTGFIHAAEEIFTGAVREVKEEAGVRDGFHERNDGLRALYMQIDTEFVELIAFRHAHNVAFQKSDLFFICMLRPLSSDIKIDETEIQAAKWMALAEFMEQPFVQEDHMFRKISDICVRRLRRRYCGLTAHHVVSKFDGGTSTLYYEPESSGDRN
ncbi:hypothetical protein U9M48_022554 [Paspalum notatum var. saurae]|uniref:Nudix hydrolase domain-containing protein n=1 Tax=Paspalum notatum var. saurae TaxID=547442 RepID=A0AAQ3TM16_PASNO